MFQALVRWNKLTFVILPGYTVVATDRLYYDYLIRTNFREALISQFSRFVKNREIKDSLKLGYAKIKQAKFNTLL